MTPKQKHVLDLFGERRAPNGSLVRDNFAQWFGNSVVTEADGRPKTVYHGTARAFKRFSDKLLGKKTGGLDAKLGFFFAENPKAAEMFIWASGSPFDGNIMPVYLKLENPLVVKDLVLDGSCGTRAGKIMQKAKFDGYDGVIFEQSDMLGHKGKSYAVFDAASIKSSTGNSGAFKPDSRCLSDLPANRTQGQRVAKITERDQYFTLDALNRAANADDGLLVYMSPSVFLSLAAEGGSSVRQQEVNALQRAGEKFNGVPELFLTFGPDGDARVTDHDGRHRARALQSAGVESMPVALAGRYAGPVGQKIGFVEADVQTIQGQDGKSTLFLPNGLKNGLGNAHLEINQDMCGQPERVRA